MNYRIQIMCSIQIQKVKMKSVVQMINTIQMMMIQLLVFLMKTVKKLKIQCMIIPKIQYQITMKMKKEDNIIEKFNVTQKMSMLR